MQDDYKAVQQHLLHWFQQVCRPLPWRTTYDPYAVWISEIMLQQTQMERGVSYFIRWIERFPDIASVAEADEQEILKYWEGLGYYARARNLHKAAKVLLQDFGGTIPCDPKILLSLPGIGPYTAAAISSIACNVDIPVVDANVMRVYARIFDIDTPIKNSRTRRRIEQLAAALLPSGKARRFNQALMDLGGLVCTPKSPQCDECPVHRYCLAHLRGTVADRPVAMGKQKTILIEMATGILEYEGRIFIQQRRNDDIWGGLWEFPGGSLEKGETAAKAVVREFSEETGFSVSICREITTITHYHTKYKVLLHCFACSLDNTDDTEPVLTAAQQCRWIIPEDIQQYGFPAGHRKLLEYIHETCPEMLMDPCRSERVSSSKAI